MTPLVAILRDDEQGRQALDALVGRAQAHGIAVSVRPTAHGIGVYCAADPGTTEAFDRICDRLTGKEATNG